MARKTGLGPQGRRTIDEARAGDGPSKGAFSEIPGRVESGQTKPVDTIPGYVTASERPTPAPGGLLGDPLRRGGPGGRLLPNGTRYTGPVNPNDVVPISNPVASSNTSPAMTLNPGTVSGNTPSGANAGPGRSGPVNTSYGGGGGTPVISGTSAPGGGGGGGGGGVPQTGVPWIDLVVQGAKAAVTPSPYAPMTWMERNLSAEGLSMLYGNGAGAQPLNGYQTSRFHIQPKKKDPSDNFHSARHDPNIAEQPALEQRRSNGSHQEGTELPVFQQGGNTTAAQRMHRDPLHEYNTGQGYAGTHVDAIGNTWGDAHTRATSGMSTPENPFNVQPIRAPQPE